MAINVEYLEKCILTLETSYQMINSVKKDSIQYEMYRNSLVKSFEITLELAGKLLRKCLEPFMASKRAADSLTFKDVFRYANKFSLIGDKAVENWFKYRDNRNDTVHDYGVKFAKETLKLVEDFIYDVKKLKDVIKDEK